MSQDAPSVAETGLGSVATENPGMDTGNGLSCLKCGRPFPRYRKGRRACSSRCRWALWKAAQTAKAQARQDRDEARRIRDTEIREHLTAALRALDPEAR